MRLFSTEQVSKYHPDKYADQISDAILDKCLSLDKQSHVACETMVKGNTVILAGEINCSERFDAAEVVHSVADKLGYKAERIITYLDQQSPEICRSVSTGDDLRAGDQGVMFGYACRESDSLLPFGFDLANRIIAAIEKDVETNPDTLFKGDAKCRVTTNLDPRIKTSMDSVRAVLVSACNKTGYSIFDVRHAISKILQSCGIDTKKVKVIANPAGVWTVGGPAADCGLTGRKIVCDQYGGYVPVGGGAFSGKDPSKVDRSGAYMARKIACDMVEKYNLDWCRVQLAYAIGEKEPMSVCVTSTSPCFDRDFSDEVKRSYDLTPAGIIKELNLLNVKYEKMAEGCHFRKGLEQWYAV